MWRLEDGKSRQSKEAKAGPSEEKFVEDTDTLSKRNLAHESKFIVRSLAFLLCFPVASALPAAVLVLFLFVLQALLRSLPPSPPPESSSCVA